MPTCRLCLQDKDLIGRSHIIPDFLYKHSGMYDEKHRMRSFTIDDLVSGRKPSLPQSGVHEGGILCADCDNRILGQNLENYAKKAIYGGGQLPTHECPECKTYENGKGQVFSICENLSYGKYKLFLLSILWRASISSKSFFSEINIGQHENVLREMILTNDPRNFNDYPVFIVTTASDKEFTSDMIIQPRQIIGSDGVETCCFIIGGFIYIFKLGTLNEKLDEMRHQTINEDNKAMFPHTQQGTTIKFIKNFVGY